MTGVHEQTVMFADIAGSTSLYERLGDREALLRISTCIDRLAGAVRQSGGRLVKTIGDEVMCVFDDPAGAVRAATDMQLGQRGAGDGLGLRVGFHHGEVIGRNGDVFGDSVNVAARVAALAKAGQILTTETSLSRLPPLARAGARPMGPIGVRGKEQALPVCEIIWAWADNLTMVDSGRAGVDATPALRTLHLRCGAVERELAGIAGAVLSFGRDPGSDIVVACPRASRLHGRIEVRQSGFVIVDLSSNGTYLYNESGDEILLRREEALLQGVGAIGAGVRLSEASASALQYRCA